MPKRKAESQLNPDSVDQDSFDGDDDGTTSWTPLSAEELKASGRRFLSADPKYSQPDEEATSTTSTGSTQFKFTFTPATTATPATPATSTESDSSKKLWETKATSSNFDWKSGSGDQTDSAKPMWSFPAVGTKESQFKFAWTPTEKKTEEQKKDEEPKKPFTFLPEKTTSSEASTESAAPKPVFSFTSTPLTFSSVTPEKSSDAPVSFATWTPSTDGAFKYNPIESSDSTKFGENTTTDSDNSPAVDHVSGEEDETTVFTMKGVTLYTIADGKWKESGKGTFKINQNKEDKQKFRIIMRTDGTLQLKLNVMLYQSMPMKKQTSTTVLFIGIVGEEGSEPTSVRYLTRLRCPADADALYAALEQYRAQCAGAATTSSSTTAAKKQEEKEEKKPEKQEEKKEDKQEKKEEPAAQSSEAAVAKDSVQLQSSFPSNFTFGAGTTPSANSVSMTSSFPSEFKFGAPSSGAATKEEEKKKEEEKREEEKKEETKKEEEKKEEKNAVGITKEFPSNFTFGSGTGATVSLSNSFPSDFKFGNSN